MRHLDLFSGFGGFALAAHAVGIETVAFCEIEPYPVRILRRHWPDVPVFPDVRELTADALAHAASRESWEQGARNGRFGSRRGCEARGGIDLITADAGGQDDTAGGSDVLADTELPRRDGGTQRDGESQSPAEGTEASQWLDPDRRATGKRRPGPVGSGGHTQAGCAPLLITAGFPCQDLSFAGKGAGLDGERSGLYREVVRLAGELRPRWILLENVAALLTRGLDVALGDFAALGYDALWATVPACAVGAPHRRDRVWVVLTTTDADLEAMYSRVLSRLTPYGDLATDWPTATASDAWAPVGGRGNVIPCNGWVLTGKAGLSLGHAASMNGTWPTPNHRNYKGSPGPGYEGQASLPRETELGTRQNGALNPDWVETLMGLPIGYTLPDGEPMRELPNVWPAGEWLTPNTMDHLTPRSEEAQENARRRGHADQPLRANTGNLREQVQAWPAGLGAEQYPWEPPRLTTVKENRANRLKALGDGIVPQVALLWLHAIMEEDA